MGYRDLVGGFRFQRNSVISKINGKLLLNSFEIKSGNFQFLQSCSGYFSRSKKILKGTDLLLFTGVILNSA